MRERRTSRANPREALTWPEPAGRHASCAEMGMTTETKHPGAHRFVALELAIEIVAGLRDVVDVIRKRDRDTDLARQIVRSASSIAANLAEAGGRQGKDRLHHFRIAAGSTHETVAHLRVVVAWGWIQQRDIESVLRLLERERAILWRLTH